MSDCSEVYRLGFTLPGPYLIDPTGKRDQHSAVEVYCQDGWTYVLRRQSGSQVRFNFYEAQRL